MLDSIEDYEWKETDISLGEKTYRNMNQDLLYIEDTYDDGTELPQTDFSDFQQDRYEIKIRRNYQPPETEDETLHSTMNWDEAEAFLEAKAGDFQ